MDERIHKLNEMVDKGIDEIVSKGALNNKDVVCLAGELIDIRKDIATIEAMEESGYTEMYPRYYMDDGMSYARHGRDGDGDGRYNEGRRYSRRGSYGNSYGESYGDSYRGRYGRRGYSRDDGKEEMIEHLERAMRKATTEQERQSIQRMIEQAENG